MATNITRNISLNLKINDDAVAEFVNSLPENKLDDMFAKLVQTCLNLGNARPDGSSDHWAFISIAESNDGE